MVSVLSVVCTLLSLYQIYINLNSSTAGLFFIASIFSTIIALYTGLMSIPQSWILLYNSFTKEHSDKLTLIWENFYNVSSIEVFKVKIQSIKNEFDEGIYFLKKTWESGNKSLVIKRVLFLFIILVIDFIIIFNLNKVQQFFDKGIEIIGNTILFIFNNNQEDAIIFFSVMIAGVLLVVNLIKLFRAVRNSIEQTFMYFYRMIVLLIYFLIFSNILFFNEIYDLIFNIIIFLFLLIPIVAVIEKIILWVKRSNSIV